MLAEELLQPNVERQLRDEDGMGCRSGAVWLSISAFLLACGSPEDREHQHKRTVIKGGCEVIGRRASGDSARGHQGLSCHRLLTITQFHSDALR